MKTFTPRFTLVTFLPWSGWSGWRPVPAWIVVAAWLFDHHRPRGRSLRS